jgi:CRISPR-associated protein Csx3
VRLGWVAPPGLVVDPGRSSPLLIARLLDCQAHARLEIALAGGYLDYGEAEGLYLPPLPPGRGVVLSGKLPLWLWTALARTYHHAPWVAIFQPQLGNQTVVVASRDESVPIGSLLTTPHG